MQMQWDAIHLWAKCTLSKYSQNQKSFWLPSVFHSHWPDFATTEQDYAYYSQIDANFYFEVGFAFTPEVSPGKKACMAAATWAGNLADD